MAVRMPPSLRMVLIALTPWQPADVRQPADRLHDRSCIAYAQNAIPDEGGNGEEDIDSEGRVEPGFSDSGATHPRHPRTTPNWTSWCSENG